MLALILIITGIFLRLIPHAPNFTPVAAIALFSGVYLKRKSSLLTPFLLMVISDILIGLHDVIIFTWGSFLLISLLGTHLKRRKTSANILSFSLLSSFLFFMLTNFGVWLKGWYPHTLKGLVDCYIMALPFLRNFTLATLFYSAMLFGSYELVFLLVKEKRLAKVLL